MYAVPDLLLYTSLPPMKDEIMSVSSTSKAISESRLPNWDLSLMLAIIYRVSG